MESDVLVGGDSSVMWTVNAANARFSSIRSKREGDHGYLQSGVDETPFDEPFRIGIKVPQNGGQEFARALRAAAEDAEKHAGEPGYVVTFTLPIEPKNVDQIQIRWTASEPARKKPSLLEQLKGKVRTASKALAKKAGRKKAAPKKAARGGKKKGAARKKR